MPSGPPANVLEVHQVLECGTLQLVLVHIHVAVHDVTPADAAALLFPHHCHELLVVNRSTLQRQKFSVQQRT